ncbi:MAG: sulfotransferase family protein [Deltaproteobacteria bacterium]|nr:sulfotransferase family protein [Deltaproteobacteria bacterium]MBW2668192.1 sulfotransferase family protein [Deltaproteobacteria bacterium]
MSGVPRSGTSLMMQMLAAGGIDLLADLERAPNADNPRGYFEFAPVKRLRDEASWFPEAVGRAVKVVYALLKSLPDDVPARIVFMQRDLAEVVASQRAMLARSGNPTEVLPAERMIEIFQAQVDEMLAWVSQQPRLQLLEVAHAEAIRDPASVAGAVDAFLGGGLDVGAMAAVPDPALYHQRASASADQGSETPVRS